MRLLLLDDRFAFSDDVLLGGTGVLGDAKLFDPLKLPVVLLPFAHELFAFGDETGEYIVLHGCLPIHRSFILGMHSICIIRKREKEQANQNGNALRIIL